MGLCGNKAFFTAVPYRDLDGFDYYSGFRAFPEGLSSRELDEWKTMVLSWFMAGLRSLHHPLFCFDAAVVVQNGCRIVSFLRGSTTGKTILLQLPCVHGHGGEPGSAASVNILRWNTTRMRLRKPESYSGILACIDELGAYKQKDFASLLYNITASKVRIE
jgi:hypothetical protein